MTGRIQLLSFVTASGLIEAGKGLRIPFDFSEVLAYDVARLAVGQVVSFQCGNGKAWKVSVERTPARSPQEVARKGGVFRYLGFNHADSVRTFRFERQLVGEQVELFTVSTDLALLAKYHISVQEVPALCSRLLTLEWNDMGGPILERNLTEEDILADMASRPSLVSKHRKGPAASPRTEGAKTKSPHPDLHG